jgi:hypothetical protein
MLIMNCIKINLIEINFIIKWVVVVGNKM